MLKWIARKILGEPNIIDAAVFAKQDADRVILNLSRLAAAMESGDTRRADLLRTWLRNRGIQPPVTVTDCRNEIVRIHGHSG